ncbi:hypothetical protein OGAPHI_001890 [Ogataea philodendri]|uniref:Uncharacterized protein n=1 Tax=Ogataea philodendri TaxID=1378263 RepID=A0A9P8T7N0_9ASCO|nr:uncharacterized protein OGAPHI_001890 [Ogataea philodendri]KAH3668136.1 hypothetical protein OGAPHI_001890 [Ogataea philodendri]
MENRNGGIDVQLYSRSILGLSSCVDFPFSLDAGVGDELRTSCVFLSRSAGSPEIVASLIGTLNHLESAVGGAAVVTVEAMFDEDECRTCLCKFEFLQLFGAHMAVMDFVVENCLDRQDIFAVESGLDSALKQFDDENTPVPFGWHKEVVLANNLGNNRHRDLVPGLDTHLPAVNGQYSLTVLDNSLTGRTVVVGDCKFHDIGDV